MLYLLRIILIQEIKKNKEKVKRFTKFRRLIQEKELFAHK